MFSAVKLTRRNNFITHERIQKVGPRDACIFITTIFYRHSCGGVDDFIFSDISLSTVWHSRNAFRLGVEGSSWLSTSDLTVCLSVTSFIGKLIIFSKKPGNKRVDICLEKQVGTLRKSESPTSSSSGSSKLSCRQSWTRTFVPWGDDPMIFVINPERIWLLAEKGTWRPM